jgi:gliding motility-associated-like protein
VNISVFPQINPTLTDQEEQCLPDNKFFFEAGGIYGSGATFNWDFGDGNGGPGDDTLSHSYLDTGTYTVTLTIEDNGCTETISTELTVYDVPVATFSIDKSIGCSPFEVTFDATSSTPEIADSQYIFIWDFGDGSPLDSSQNTIHTYSNDSIYYPSLTIILGTCAGYEQMTQSVTVEALPTPTAGIVLDPPVASLYDPIVSILDVSQGADSCYLVLSSGDTINACNYIQNYFDPNAPYNETTTHYITQYVTNGAGCQDSIIVWIDVLPEYIFFAPSSFTPNNDGTNDLFFGKGFGIKKFEMFIFNRWGDLIWETRDQYDGWNGYANGGDHEAQQGVYVYLVSIVDIYDLPHEVVGKVVLIR